MHSKTFLRIILIAAVVCSAQVLAQDKKDPAHADLDKLQGDWTIQSIERDPKEKPGEGSGIKVHIKDNLVTAFLPGQNQPAGALTIKLDPNQTPPAIDLRVGGSKEDAAHGIYEIRGDTLRVCLTPIDKGERPKEFSSKPGSGHSLFTLKRPKVVPTLSKQERAAIVAAASQAIRSHLQIQKKDLIDPGFWGVAIASLKPIRVRNDKVNVAIVLSENGGVEEGLYVSIPISSYAAQVGDRFAVMDPLSRDEDQTFGRLYHYKMQPKAK